MLFCPHWSPEMPDFPKVREELILVDFQIKLSTKLTSRFLAPKPQSTFFCFSKRLVFTIIQVSLIASEL